MKVRWINKATQLSIAVLMLMLTFVLFPEYASAAQQCFNEESYSSASGTALCEIDEATNTPTGICIVSSVIKEIKDVLENAAGNMFTTIASSLAAKVIPAVLTLYFAIYGIMFAIGMIQVNAWDAFTRLFKIGIIATLMSASGWMFFNTYVGGFFRDGTDDLIRESSLVMIENFEATSMNSESATRHVASIRAAMDTFEYKSAGSNPFLPVDILVSDILNPKTLAIMQAAMEGGFNGFGITYLAVFLISVIFLILSIARALWVYLMSLLCTALLFGLAPIFITFILFQRTKGIFDGWLNTLISFSLQPVLMFMFFGLFTSIMSVSIVDIQKDVNVSYASDGAEGSWNFSNEDCSVECAMTADGLIGSITGAETTQTDEVCSEITQDISDIFPNLLIFLLLAYICWNFFDFIGNIAMTLAGGMSLARMEGFLHGMAQQGSSKLTTEVINKIKGSG